MKVGSYESDPVAPTLALPVRITMSYVRGLLKTRLTKVIDLYLALHLEHYGGKYSIERMLALEEYTRNTSLERVLLVSIGVPLFVVGLVLVQESVPLQDPADGWAANYGFWIRAALVGVGIGNAASIQIGFWLDVPPFSFKQILGYCTLMATGYVAAGMMTAMYWVFPIPFFMFTLCVVTSSVILVYIRLVVGAQGFREILSRRQQLRRLNRVGMVQSLMFIVYPAYQILFTKANQTPYEIPVLMILPMVRLVLKLVFASVAADKEDMIPVQVVFTVDFFDAFYFASFIQSVSSLTLAGVMAIDLIQTAGELYEMNQRTRRILFRLHRLPGVQLQNIDNLLEAVRVVLATIDTLRFRIPKTIQVRSCIYHQLSEEGRTLLDKIERQYCTESCVNSFQYNLKTLSTPALVVPVSGSTQKPSRLKWFKCCSRSKVVAQGVTVSTSLPSSPKKNDISAGVHRNSRKLSLVTASMVLNEALEVLFTSECLVLTEYMEVIVPMVYGLFVLAMVRLPSAKYHTELAEVNNENVVNIVSRIFAYALMEFGSFVILAVAKKRNCGINALYQLAFVLETQTLFVQSTLMMWILMTLTYRVVHFGLIVCCALGPGCDFTFRFEWIMPRVISSARSTNQSRSRSKSLWKTILNLYLSLQIAHYGGKYSIERMLAFDEYTRNTSIFRVLLVVVLLLSFVVWYFVKKPSRFKILLMVGERTMDFGYEQDWLVLALAMLPQSKLVSGLMLLRFQQSKLWSIVS
ncbi:LOW QUALITY PROTEIN: hypothetical protein PHMEG_00021328 [Phytophthora megakarya]|uniref:Transmembrane protein n=1 Tax=Phytophthora megakarya TaxID=4795 RepID=A0A225VN16_9STRA|nr:LOW QUALITY PROTEIN: hypothetical protein PHMEG_00021328 [Phytophthora megakarya]